MTKKKISKKLLEDLVVLKSPSRYGLTVIITQTKEEIWRVEKLASALSIEQLESGLRDGELYIQPTDVDNSNAIVLSTALGTSATVMAHLVNDGGSDGCDVKYRAERYGK